MATLRQDTYRCFGALLDYPESDLLQQARTCADLLDQQACHQAAAHIRDFVAYLENQPSLGRLEEIYTGTFDVNPACFIFAGYLLFGESFKRAKFLVRLQEKYAERGFSAGNELADHLAVMLRFMAVLDEESEEDEKLARQLVENCFLPVLDQMSANFKPGESGELNPYADVLRAVSLTLEQTAQAVPAAV